MVHMKRKKSEMNKKNNNKQRSNQPEECLSTLCKRFFHLRTPLMFSNQFGWAAVAVVIINACLDQVWSYKNNNNPTQMENRTDKGWAWDIFVYLLIRSHL